MEDFLFREYRMIRIISVEVPFLDMIGRSGLTLLRTVMNSYSAVTNDGYDGCSFRLFIASAHHHVAYIWLV